MDHIGRVGPRVPPVQPAGPSTSHHDRRDRRHRSANQDTPQKDPADAHPFSRPAPAAVGPAWWYAVAPDVVSQDRGQDRLRTAQMQRAVRDVAAMAQPGPPRAPAAVSGEILEEDDPGGGDARVIDPDNIGGV